MNIDINTLPIVSYVGLVIHQEMKNTDIRKVKIIFEGYDKTTQHPRKVEIERDI